MGVDALIVVFYFVIIFTMAIQARVGKDATVEEYYLSSRNLSWYSIAVSTIATNIQGYQLLGMMGSAYLYGLAQANLEINAVQGLLLAAFVFVPMYLKDKVITITQFISNKIGPKVALIYSSANLILFATIGLGAALFWGAYAADLVFKDYLLFISDDAFTRVSIIIIFLGIFSAIYTYLGGLNAVVKTDVIQFSILMFGACAVLWIVMVKNGGWSALYEKTPELMHLHLPSTHEKLPWTMLFGLFFLNINYWCANQTVIQRSLAAKSLREAQKGLLAGGVIKYFMAILIIIPGIALAGLLGSNGLSDPDQSFPYIVTNYIPVGLRGIILCALFASLMSTVDSTFNSLATLFSIDIYKTYLKPSASDQEVVAVGKKTILFSLFTGIGMGIILLYLKFNNPYSSFTHTLNELRYFINCGIVIIILSAAFIIVRNERMILLGCLLSIPLNLAIKFSFPDINYFVRAGLVIASIFFAIVITASFKKDVKNPIQSFVSSGGKMTIFGRLLLLSLIIIHIIFS